MSDTAKVNGIGCFEEPPRPPKKALTPEEMREATKNLRIANRYRRSVIESQVLMEAWGAYDGSSFGFGGTDTSEVFLRIRQQSQGLAIPPANQNDRRSGRKWPMWLSDQERNRVLQASRVLCATNDFAKAMLRNQCNFTIGKGFSYDAGPKNDKPFQPDPDADEETNKAAEKEYRIRKNGVQKIVDAVQKWMDEFCARTNWNTAAESNDVAEDGSVGAASSTKERESHWRVDRDGEAIIRLFYHSNGKTDIRFVGPEVVWGVPAGHSEYTGWSYGIQHLVIEDVDEDGRRVRIVDLERIVAYYVRPHAVGLETKPKQTAPSGEVVPAAEIIHIKDPWEDAEVKRGTPVFAYDTFDALIRASNLVRNVSITSSVQAATAEVWKHTIGTKDQINSLAAGLPLARTSQDVLTGNTVTEQRIRPGMVRRVPAGQEPVPDPATTQVPNYLQASAADLRQAGAGASMAEYMISADSSNSNYASTQEAGTPYVRAAEARQEHYKTAFLRLMWRVIRHAVKCGKLPEEALTLVSIKVEGMEIHKNNEGELASARTQNLTNKVTSPQIECAKLGNDWTQVKSDWKEYDKDMTPQQPGGMPGAPPGAQPGAAPQPGGESPPGGQEADQNDPLAGVPEEDLSGQFEEQKSVDAKKSIAAKQGWAKRPHETKPVQPLVESRRNDGRQWVKVPAEILAMIGGG